MNNTLMNSVLHTATTHSLLVQSVDQWIPDVQNLLKHFQFLPRWRLDDTW
ncbi:MAG: hypothetical protein R3E63_07435 [Pseudomonadales bacterium]